MSLIELVDNTRTDKNTVHSYLNLYEHLLNKKKYTAKNVLEIGILYGGSIKLWHDYFENATVYALDVMPEYQVWPELKNKERIKIHAATDAYNYEQFTYTFLNNNVKFDMILDDGPHTLESMKSYITLYSQVLCDDGILILEDIQDESWFKILVECVPDHLKKFIKLYDLRANKNRYDDLVLVIDKSDNTGGQ